MSTQITINDVGSAEDFLAAIEGTIKNFNDGDLVAGIVVQVDREEVLLDIGYKTEGVIPSRELSIRHDLDPSEIVKVGEQSLGKISSGRKQDEKGLTYATVKVGNVRFELPNNPIVNTFLKWHQAIAEANKVARSKY